MLHVVSFARLCGLSEPLARRKPIAFVDLLKMLSGLSETHVGIH